MNRRQILQNSGLLLGLAAVAPWALRAASSQAEELPAVHEDDRILGDPDAPVTIIEYSSLTCPHCATFHSDTLPQIKSDWIEPGKARLVYRHFPLGGMAAVAASVVNCLEGPRYFALLETLFKNQQTWAARQVPRDLEGYLKQRCQAGPPASADDDPFGILKGMVKIAGINEEAFEACLCDREELQRIMETARQGAIDFEIQSTPSFVVNGQKVVGAVPYEDFVKVLNEASPPS